MRDKRYAGIKENEEESMTQTLPLVSIVTPAYNQAEYLAETIESVLAQDYPHIEYIVIDDGSTDNTQSVLERFHGRLRYERQENMGQARTLNKGWAMAGGALIGYLSSDDRLDPKAVSQLVQALTQHPEAVVAYCDFELIDIKSRVFRKVRTEDYDSKRLSVDLVCQPGPGALFRRSVFDSTGGWAESLRQVPDFEFWLRAARSGSFVRVPKLLAQYRIHEGSASFRPTSFERSMEIVNVMDGYWNGQSNPVASKSMATARLLAAKSHAQSGRIKESMVQFGKALRHQPTIILSLAPWRIYLSGLLRRALHRMLRRGK